MNIKAVQYPIVSVSYATYDLRGMLDDNQIVEDVMSRQDLRIEPNPAHTGYEDTFLPETPEIEKLLGIVTACIHNIEPNMEMIDKWAHIIEHNQSTMIHSHGDSQDALSWCYYAKYPENGGKLVFMGSAFNKDFRVAVPGYEGLLVIFPGYLNHFTQRNVSGEVRVSLSGNFRLTGMPGSKFEEYVGVLRGTS